MFPRKPGWISEHCSHCGGLLGGVSHGDTRPRDRRLYLTFPRSRRRGAAALTRGAAALTRGVTARNSSRVGGYAMASRNASTAFSTQPGRRSATVITQPVTWAGGSSGMDHPGRERRLAPADSLHLAAEFPCELHGFLRPGCPGCGPRCRALCGFPAVIAAAGGFVTPVCPLCGNPALRHSGIPGKVPGVCVAG
jgi:hypothetical protein